MSNELPKQYEPRQAQQRWLQFWKERGFFHSRPDAAREPFAIVIPPPNVTGALHMGHALNNTLQDVLIRWRRMQGYNAEWMPGTDHAGIATQSVVERIAREQEKKSRYDLGRDELVKRIWQWKEKYEARILGQLREMGCSCDWPRTRFTLDEVCARAVRQTFFTMFQGGLIYRGKGLVNWDTQLQTSVADDETYTEEVKGGFWTFRYKVKERPGEFIRFSTTRPETMLGDTAVCVHPGDERYRHLVGKTVTVPLPGVMREIPIIADGLLADPELGTGCVKVTPAHDPNDYACALRQKLRMINILNPDGTINGNGGRYAGMDRYQAREAVTKDMEALGLFEGHEDRLIPLKFSDRSKTPIEPYLSDQWFVKMGERGDGQPGLAQLAIDAVTSGHVRFFPERYAKTYLDWLGEKRDWCISRQLWWGHRIPVWSRPAENSRAAKQLQEQLQADPLIAQAIHTGRMAISLQSEGEGYELVSPISGQGATAEHFRPLNFIHVCVLNDDPAIVDVLQEHKYVQSDDVLDTWFSSALWPHSTFGWPGPPFADRPPGSQNPDWSELKYYYPTSVLVTNRDIITLWVARMVMFGLYNVGSVPFHHVYIHPKVMDAFGEGMSKTKGNGVDPLDIIDTYGADALRFLVVQLATETQDARLPVANVCPHCGTLVPVKQEHMYMRTRKVICTGDKAKGIKCDKPFRPGGPWPAADPELLTARQASERFELGRNFANKLWNAARFILMNLEGYQPGVVKPEELPIEDRWILSRLATTAGEVTAALEGYHFSEVARVLYDFTWSEFCDWYIEMAKGRLKDPAGRSSVQRVLIGVLDGILRLVQPVMPFVAESVWQALNESAFERGLPSPEPAAESVVIAPWPKLPDGWADAAMERRFALMQALVRGIREVRNRYMIDPKTMLDVAVRSSELVAADFRSLAPFIAALAGVGQVESGPAVAKPAQASTQVHPQFEAYVSLKGLIDPAAEVTRLEKQLADKRKQLEGTQKKLANPDFKARAPREVVEQQEALVSELEKQIQVLEGTIGDLQAG